MKIASLMRSKELFPNVWTSQQYKSAARHVVRKTVLCLEFRATVTLFSVILTLLPAVVPRLVYKGTRGARQGVIVSRHLMLPVAAQSKRRALTSHLNR